MKIRPVGAELFHTDGRTVMTNHKQRQSKVKHKSVF